MEDIVKLNNIDDIVLKALKFFCYIARIQMFIDGNKRVAQLIANKILIQKNIGIFQVCLEKLEEFKTLLINFYETSDDTQLIDFMQKYCVKFIPHEIIVVDNIKSVLFPKNEEDKEFLTIYKYINENYDLRIKPIRVDVTEVSKATGKKEELIRKFLENQN